MKLLLTCSIFLSAALFANPSWYHNINKNDPNKYIGYGQGSSLVKAKESALVSICSQMSTSVSTSFKKNKKNVNGDLRSYDEFTSEQTSAATISDYKILKSTQENGVHYIAVEFENIPSLDKFVSKVKARGIPIDTFQNSYLKHTMISKKLNKAFKQNINFELFRKDKEWHLKYGGTIQKLDNKDFSKFFTSVESENLAIKLDKKRKILYDGETFYFEVNSKKKGYVSILTVYENGTVSTLVRNIPMKKGVKENVPDKDFETIPEAGLLLKGVETYDLYVAVYSEVKINFDQFAYADSSIINEEKYKNFNDLIELIEDKTYATLKVVTKPKKR